MYTYEIGGKTYIQKKLVLGQIGMMSQLLSTARFSAMDAVGLVVGLGELLPRALAVVLTPEGMHPSKKNLIALEEEFYDVDPELAIKVIEDFFECNPLPLLLEKVVGLVELFMKKK